MATVFLQIFRKNHKFLRKFHFLAALDEVESLVKHCSVDEKAAFKPPHLNVEEPIIESERRDFVFFRFR